MLAPACSADWEPWPPRQRPAWTLPPALRMMQQQVRSAGQRSQGRDMMPYSSWAHAFQGRFRAHAHVCPGHAGKSQATRRMSKRRASAVNATAATPAASVVPSVADAADCTPAKRRRFQKAQPTAAAVPPPAPCSVAPPHSPRTMVAQEAAAAATPIDLTLDDTPVKCTAPPAAAPCSGNAVMTRASRSAKRALSAVKKPVSMPIIAVLAFVQQPFVQHAYS